MSSKFDIKCKKCNGRDISIFVGMKDDYCVFISCNKCKNEEVRIK